MDYTKEQKKTELLIAEYGMKLVISRHDVVLTKTVGVFIASEETNVKGDAPSGITMMNTKQKTVLIPGTIKRKPKVGDDLTSAVGVYHVIKVDEVNPGGIPIVYKVTAT